MQFNGASEINQREYIEYYVRKHQRAGDFAELPSIIALSYALDLEIFIDVKGHNQNLIINAVLLENRKAPVMIYFDMHGKHYQGYVRSHQ